MTPCVWAAPVSGNSSPTAKKPCSARSCCSWTAKKFRCWNPAASFGLPMRSPPRSLSMPLRDDLLTPIPGDNPSGVNLQYDVKVFDVIKEARIEDDESIPTGNWGRSAKKADRNLVIKVAGDSLAKRS